VTTTLKTGSRQFDVVSEL